MDMADEPLVILTWIRYDKAAAPLVGATCWRLKVVFRSTLDPSASLEAKHAEAVSYLLTELNLSYNFHIYSAWSPRGSNRVHMVIPRN